MGSNRKPVPPESDYEYVEVRRMTEAARAKYYAEGQAAFLAEPQYDRRGSYELCPYHCGRSEGTAWRAGYDEAQQEAFRQERADPLQLEFDEVTRHASLRIR